METRRTKLLNRLWDEQNIAYSLMVEYDSLPHQYGQHVLFQAEGYVINCIASYPGITVTELAGILKKTPSACSQIVRKLSDKGLVEQKRNVKNKRSYNLCLTEEGAARLPGLGGGPCLILAPPPSARQGRPFRSLDGMRLFAKKLAA